MNHADLPLLVPWLTCCSSGSHERLGHTAGQTPGSSSNTGLVSFEGIPSLPWQIASNTTARCASGLAALPAHSYHQLSNEHHTDQSASDRACQHSILQRRSQKPQMAARAGILLANFPTEHRLIQVLGGPKTPPTISTDRSLLAATLWPDHKYTFHSSRKAYTTPLHVHMHPQRLSLPTTPAFRPALIDTNLYRTSTTTQRASMMRNVCSGSASCLLQQTFDMVCSVTTI